MSRNAHTVFLALCMYPSRLLLLGVALGSIFGCDEHRTSSRPPTPQSTAASEPSPHESVPVKDEALKPGSTTRGAPRPSAVPSLSPSASPGPRCVIERVVRAGNHPKPASECPEAPTVPPNLRHQTVRFPDSKSQPSVDVEVCESKSARTRGLMYRTQLEAGQGMLFVWDHEATRSFWMRNTCIPLDMLCIDAQHTIVGIIEQVPTMNEASRRIPCPARYVLEVPSGWTRAHRVQPGHSVQIVQ